jgi:hypothetical protein
MYFSLATRRDARRPLPGAAARPSDPRMGRPVATLSPRWDPPTVGNGFFPVPLVEVHPALDHR